jgi:hypothetical protein
MPALDKLHDAIYNALLKDGWAITNDPLHLKYAQDDSYVDLAAERLLAAEKQTRKIAIEIKTFGGASSINDLHNAVGQFVVYRNVLAELEPERELYLAISEAT